MKIVFFGCAAVVGFGCVSAADATVTMQFTNSNVFIPPAYTEAGFSINSAGGWRTVSDILLAQASSSTVTCTLTQSNGQNFDLLQLDSVFFNAVSTDTLRVISSTGASVSLPFNFTFALPFTGSDWTNIPFVQFELTAATASPPSARFDNIVLNPLPAPGSASLLVFAAGATHRRRRP